MKSTCGMGRSTFGDYHQPLGMIIPPLIGNPYKWVYPKPYYKVDDHPPEKQHVPWIHCLHPLPERSNSSKASNCVKLGSTEVRPFPPELQSLRVETLKGGWGALNQNHLITSTLQTATVQYAPGKVKVSSSQDLIPKKVTSSNHWKGLALLS